MSNEEESKGDIPWPAADRAEENIRAIQAAREAAKPVPEPAKSFAEMPGIPQIIPGADVPFETPAAKASPKKDNQRPQKEQLFPANDYAAIQPQIKDSPRPAKGEMAARADQGRLPESVSREIRNEAYIPSQDPSRQNSPDEDAA